MIIAIAVSNEQKEALYLKGFMETVELLWVNTSEALYQVQGAELLIDCLFNGSMIPECGTPLLIHAPIYTLTELKSIGKVARFCAWNSFLERSVWEIAVVQSSDILWLKTLMEHLGWKFQLVKDEPGLIAPRVISMVINEAYYALEQEVSSKADIDTAMKLGTNYPYGPFEWAEIIGLQNIRMLLAKLSETDMRYEPSGLLSVNV